MARVLQLERDSGGQLGFQHYQDIHFLSEYHRPQNLKYSKQENQSLILQHIASI